MICLRIEKERLKDLVLALMLALENRFFNLTMLRIIAKHVLHRHTTCQRKAWWECAFISSFTFLPSRPCNYFCRIKYWCKYKLHKPKNLCLTSQTFKNKCLLTGDHFFTPGHFSTSNNITNQILLHDAISRSYVKRKVVKNKIKGKSETLDYSFT